MDGILPGGVCDNIFANSLCSAFSATLIGVRPHLSG